MFIKITFMCFYQMTPLLLFSQDFSFTILGMSVEKWLTQTITITMKSPSKFITHNNAVILCYIAHSVDVTLHKLTNHLLSILELYEIYFNCIIVTSRWITDNNNIKCLSADYKCRWFGSFPMLIEPLVMMVCMGDLQCLCIVCFTIGNT